MKLNVYKVNKNKPIQESSIKILKYYNVKISKYQNIKISKYHTCHNDHSDRICYCYNGHFDHNDHTCHTLCHIVRIYHIDRLCNSTNSFQYFIHSIFNIYFRFCFHFHHLPPINPLKTTNQNQKPKPQIKTAQQLTHIISHFAFIFYVLSAHRKNDLFIKNPKSKTHEHQLQSTKHKNQQQRRQQHPRLQILTVPLRQNKINHQDQSQGPIENRTPMNIVIIILL